MNEIIEKENIIVEDMIYEIRGVQVMLSSDVAKLYQVDTKVLNQTIKRNINRFPEEFCFQLTKEEWRVLNLKSQIVTSSLNNNYGGVRYLPYVLTEHGIMMLAGLLKSDVAIKISIYIIKAFVKMRQYINYNKEIVKFKDKVFDKNKMGLKEFAITVLQIEPISIEIIAMYIGKLGFDVHNCNGKYSVVVTKKIKNGIKGRLVVNEK